MARLGLINSNERKKKLVKRFARKRMAMKKAAMDKSLTLEERFIANVRLARLPRSSSAVRVRSRCSMSGRPRAVLRFFGLSRIAFRDLATTGKLPGVRRSSW